MADGSFPIAKIRLMQVINAQPGGRAGKGGKSKGPLTDAAKVLASVMIDEIRQGQTLQVPRAFLAARIGAKSDGAVSALIDQLETSKLLVVERRQHAVSRYKFPLLDRPDELDRLYLAMMAPCDRHRVQWTAHGNGQSDRVEWTGDEGTGDVSTGVVSTGRKKIQIKKNMNNRNGRSPGGSALGDASETATAIAQEVAAIARVPGDLPKWPPGWTEAPMLVQAMLNSGMTRGDIVLGVTLAMKRRERRGENRPPDGFTYFRKPIKEAHDKRLEAEAGRAAAPKEPLPVDPLMDPIIEAIPADQRSWFDGVCLDIDGDVARVTASDDHQRIEIQKRFKPRVEAAICAAYPEVSRVEIVDANTAAPPHGYVRHNRAC